MRIRASAAAAAFAVLAGYGIAHADGSTQANISAVNGTVLVNQGQGFKPAVTGQVLRTGDRVIVTTRGGARLNYAGGCSVTLTPGSMATIGTLTPCKVGLRHAGVVSGQPADGPPPRDSDSPTTPFGLSPGTLALLTVGVFTLGAAGLSGAFNNSESGSP
ncbi:MAG TPA: hypothetical protein VGL66_13660 [Caulobacteraceae bacterium]|jgi:hypothetical protein